MLRGKRLPHVWMQISWDRCWIVFKVEMLLYRHKRNLSSWSWIFLGLCFLIPVFYLPPALSRQLCLCYLMLYLVLFQVFSPSAWCIVHKFWFPLPRKCLFLSLLTVIKAYFWKPSPGAFPLKKKRTESPSYQRQISRRCFLLLLFLLLLLEGEAALTLWIISCSSDLWGAVQCMKGGCDDWSSPNWSANPSSQYWFRSVLKFLGFMSLIAMCSVRYSERWMLSLCTRKVVPFCGISGF